MRARAFLSDQFVIEVDFVLLFLTSWAVKLGGKHIKHGIVLCYKLRTVINVIAEYSTTSYRRHSTSNMILVFEFGVRFKEVKEEVEKHICMQSHQFNGTMCSPAMTHKHAVILQCIYVCALGTRQKILFRTSNCIYVKISTRASSSSSSNSNHNTSITVVTATASDAVVVIVIIVIVAGIAIKRN